MKGQMGGKKCERQKTMILLRVMTNFSITRGTIRIAFKLKKFSKIILRCAIRLI